MIQLRDKLHLALLGILGPEFLLMLTLGEWSSARASVKVLDFLAWGKVIADNQVRHSRSLATTVGASRMAFTRIWADLFSTDPESQTRSPSIVVSCCFLSSMAT